MGRNLPKKQGYKRNSTNRDKNLKFPACCEIYEECKGRTEPCESCPFK